MSNEVVQSMFYNNGLVNEAAVRAIMPSTFLGSPELFAYRVLSTFRLDNDFIREKFENLNLKTLFIVNFVAEDIVFENQTLISEVMLSEILNFEVQAELGEELELTSQFLSMGYSTSVYDSIMGNIFTAINREFLDDDFADDPWNIISELLNQHVNIFSREFILENIGPKKFNLLNAALFRSDITLYDVKLRLYDVTYFDLCTVFSKFAGLSKDEDDNTLYSEMFTAERERFVKELLHEKLHNELILGK